MSNSARVLVWAGSTSTPAPGFTWDASHEAFTAGAAADHSQRRRLVALWERGVLTDVELVVPGDRIAAHRVVLAAASPFFHALFTSGMRESHEHAVELREMHAAALRELVTYMYSGQLRVSGDTILAILHTANQLEMLEVVELCCRQLMLELHVANCVDIFVCCEQLGSRTPCRLLEDAAMAMIATFLSDVVATDAFAQLPLAMLLRITARFEDPALQLVLLDAWVAHDPAARQPQVASLSPAIGCELQAKQAVAPRKTPMIFAVGGFNGPTALRSVECLDFRTGEWFAVASMHEKRSYSGTVVTPDDRLVVLGGACNLRYLRSVERFDPETNSWEELPPMRKTRSYLGAAYLDGGVFVVGGFNGMTHLASVERLDLATQRWDEMAPLHVGRSGLALVVAQGQLLAIGGYDGRRHLRSVERYDPARNEWTLLPLSMRSARNGPAALTLPHENAVLVFGGESRHGLRMSSTERLNLATGEWTEDYGAALVDCRSGHAALGFLDDAWLLCLGGSNKKDEYVSAVHRFDRLTKQWTLHSQMQAQRCGLNVVVAGVSEQAGCLKARANEMLGMDPEDADEARASSPSGSGSLARLSRRAPFY
ncbi:hypothetical protein ATCC90586_002144 [Pythium insidiosum]|nr:hypothetical protein ATCC90586_002144 [Pythium insidiosum]